VSVSNFRQAVLRGLALTALADIGERLARAQRPLLIALLAVLHAALVGVGGERLGLVWWLIDVGLFMLWQPFVHAQYRLGASALAGFSAILLAGASGYGDWLLLLWASFIAALVGGRVLFVEHRGTRIFYLLAFSFLISAVLLHLVPRMVPDPGAEGILLRQMFQWGGPAVLLTMTLVPVRAWAGRATAGPVDFVYSLFVFLLIAVLALGSLALMVVKGANYVQSLLGTLTVMGGMLLLIGWAWNPRAGFSGVGIAFSRYLLTVGLPFEQWLHRLTEIADEERDPAAFLDRALGQMLDLPWVEGGEWSAAGECGLFGSDCGRFEQDFSVLSLRLRLFTRYRLSPALVWHFRLLLQLVVEYFVAKLRERELEQVGYLRAVYETGARLTHDVKNLLQSLNNLCYVAQSLDGERAQEIQPLMQRQLPLIVQRLELTLEKLRRPRGGDAPLIDAETWWNGLRQRYAAEDVRFAVASDLAGVQVPSALFDSVADNLLQNALEKRRREPGLAIEVGYSAATRGFSVCDNGAPLAQTLADGIFRAPVASEDGLGIGLYHAALQATEHGYVLRLADNRAGSVCFELAQAAPV